MAREPCRQRAGARWPPRSPATGRCTSAGRASSPRPATGGAAWRRAWCSRARPSSSRTTPPRWWRRAPAPASTTRTISSWSAPMPESPMSTIPRVDPITLEIIRGSLASAIRDMELLMERCAMSPFIKEKKDYFVGIFDTRGRIVACHISGSGPGMLQAIMKVYPLETMRPGDVYWFNDPYISDGAVQHHQDMVFAVPIFHAGRLVALSPTFAHYQDIGGLRAGSISPHATEIYHEGVLVPPVRRRRQSPLNPAAPP